MSPTEDELEVIEREKQKRRGDEGQVRPIRTGQTVKQAGKHTKTGSGISETLSK